MRHDDLYVNSDHLPRKTQDEHGRFLRFRGERGDEVSHGPSEEKASGGTSRDCRALHQAGLLAQGSPHAPIALEFKTLTLAIQTPKRSMR